MNNLETELIGLEKKYWQAMKDGDVDAAIALTDFPCIVAGSQGVKSVDEGAFRKMFGGSAFKIQSVEIDETQVRMISDDVAVVAYTIHENLSIEGKTVELDAADTSTWIRRGGRWVCAQHSESILGDPFGGESTAS